MKTILLAFLVAAVPVAFAEETIDQVAAGARQELEKSIQELNTVRSAIAAEKIPLGEQLTQVEEKLAGLRREHEQATRTLDLGNLEVANLKNEMKLRQDEITYVATLLDEYVRNFEQKINVAEVQRYQPALEAAKQAPENAKLTAIEKSDRQLDLVKTSSTRLQEMVGGTRFDGQAVDPQGVIVDGQFAIIGPVALFASKDGQSAGLALPQSGSTKPAVRPLEAGLGAGLVAVVTEGTGLLPLDPSRGAALKALIHKVSLIDIFVKGGPIMWPLLVVSILALGAALDRFSFIIRERKKRDPRALEGLLKAVEEGKIDEAIRIGKTSQFYVVRALGYALMNRDKSLSNALLYANAQELKRYSRGVPILDTSITIAPLLGLLGTVTGMMHSFSLIGGDLGAPGAITGGISEALIATAFGLVIAITGLLPFNWINARTEDARHELEAAGSQLELLLHPLGVQLTQASHAQAHDLKPLGGPGRPVKETEAV